MCERFVACTVESERERERERQCVRGLWHVLWRARERVCVRESVCERFV